MSDIQEAVRWEISVPIFKNTVILKQLGLAIGIPFVLVAFVIVLVSGMSRDTMYALGFIAALLILTWLFVMAAYQLHLNPAKRKESGWVYKEDWRCGLPKGRWHGQDCCSVL